MRTLLFLTFTVLFSAPQDALGQDTPIDFGDTLTIEKFSFSYTTRPDTFIGDTLFILSKPQCIVVQQNRTHSVIITLLKKDKRKWKVLELCPHDQAESFTVDTINFDGKGSPELIVRWNSSFYANAMQGGWSETSSGFYLWDIDNARLIYTMQDQHSYTSLYNSHFIDSSGEPSAEVVDNSYCENYYVIIQPRKIEISYDPNCAEVDELSGMPLPQYSVEDVYELIGDYLILKK